MSDEDREIDIESDADDEDGSQTYSSEDKRAHHNALERKRRDHIKDSFHSLRDCVPQDDSKGGSSTKTSRAQILRQAAEYIIRMRDKTQQNDRHIDILKKQNDELQSQVRSLQKSQAGGKALHSSNYFDNDRDDDDSESYEEETVVSSPPTKRKKIKTSS